MRFNSVSALVPALLFGVAIPAGSSRPWSGPVADTRVVVTGVVRAAGANAPLPGAVVAGPGASAHADSGGRYTLALRLGEGQKRITLTARHIGYAPSTQTVAVTGPRLVVDFVLSQAVARLEANVTGVPERLLLRESVGYKSTGQPYVQREPQRRQDVAMDTTAASRCTSGLRRASCDSANTEGYDVIAENPFLAVRGNPRSTFSVDVDRASYSNVRRFLTQGALPPRDAVRIEELVNYFPYDNAEPRGRHPVAIATEVMAAPWQPEHRLVRVTLQAKRMAARELPPSNLVFLVDVSGSMQSEDRLPLVQRSLRLLVDELRAQDRVAIVVYAGAAGLVLPSTPGNEKRRIMAAIDGLSAGGSTAGGAGIRLAYQVAKENFARNGNNRVILATDGDFNVGVSSDAELVQLIEQKRAEGTFLTVLGYGMGNYKDNRLEKLADKGNGNYAYVDDIVEARKTLVQEMGGTLVTVAKDVKIQVEFNPVKVRGYRLIGYENRALRDEDFTDDTKDAGEIGAGHTVTALYEIIPAGARSPVVLRETSPLRYERDERTATTAAEDELLHVAVRYKQPSGTASAELTHPVRDRVARPSDDFVFAAAVASFGMLLRESPHAGNASIEDVIAAAQRSVGRDEFGYRAGFVSMARDAQRLLVARKSGVAVNDAP
jgi:Ca-activated chloride channel homolog